MRIIEEILFIIAKNWKEPNCISLVNAWTSTSKTWETTQQFTCNKMDDSHKHHFKWKKTETKYMLYDSTDVVFWKRQW